VLSGESGIGHFFSYSKPGMARNIPYDFCVLEKDDIEIAKKLIAIRSKT